MDHLLFCRKKADAASAGYAAEGCHLAGFGGTDSEGKMEFVLR